MVAQVASAGNMSRREYFDRLRYQQARSPWTNSAFCGPSTRTIRSTAPTARTSSDFKRDNLTQEDSSVIGSSAALADIRDIGIVSGRFFTDQEEKSRAFVAVIGDDTRANLFPEGTPLGKTFKIKGIDFTVIGVQEKLGAAFGVSRDKSAYIPDYLLQPPVRNGQRLCAFRARQTGHRADHAGVARPDARRAAHALPRTSGPEGPLRHPDAGFHPRLRRPDAGHDQRDRGAGDPDLAGGRRHRDHEYHAGQRHRADAGDRHPQGAGRAALHRAAADPGGVHHAVVAWRTDGHRASARC